VSIVVIIQNKEKGFAPGTQQFCTRSSGLWNLCGVKNCPLPLTKPVAVNRQGCAATHTPATTQPVHTHTHTHTHPFNGPLSRTTRVSQHPTTQFFTCQMAFCRPINIVKALKAHSSVARDDHPAVTADSTSAARLWLSYRVVIQWRN